MFYQFFFLNALQQENLPFLCVAHAGCGHIFMEESQRFTHLLPAQQQDHMSAWEHMSQHSDSHSHLIQFNLMQPVGNRFIYTNML